MNGFSFFLFVFFAPQFYCCLKWKTESIFYINTVHRTLQIVKIIVKVSGIYWYLCFNKILSCQHWDSLNIIFNVAIHTLNKKTNCTSTWVGVSYALMQYIYFELFSTEKEKQSGLVMRKSIKKLQFYWLNINIEDRKSVV